MKPSISKFRLAVLAVIFLFSSFTYIGTDIPIDPDTKLAGYKNVSDVPGLKSAELYDRGYAWIQKYYKNPVGVMKKQDKPGGEIMGKARFRISKTDKKGNVNPNGGFVSYHITLQFKEEKYRYVIDRIRWEQASYYDVSRWTDSTQANYNKAIFTSYIEQTETYFNDLTSNLESYMKVGEAKKNDDW